MGDPLRKNLMAISTFSNTYLFGWRKQITIPINHHLIRSQLKAITQCLRKGKQVLGVIPWKPPVCSTEQSLLRWLKTNILSAPRRQPACSMIARQLVDGKILRPDFPITCKLKCCRKCPPVRVSFKAIRTQTMQELVEPVPSAQWSPKSFEPFIIGQPRMLPGGENVISRFILCEDALMRVRSLMSARMPWNTSVESNATGMGHFR